MSNTQDYSKPFDGQRVEDEILYNPNVPSSQKIPIAIIRRLAKKTFIESRSARQIERKFVSILAAVSTKTVSRAIKIGAEQEYFDVEEISTRIGKRNYFLYREFSDVHKSYVKKAIENLKEYGQRYSIPETIRIGDMDSLSRSLVEPNNKPNNNYSFNNKLLKDEKFSQNQNFSSSASHSSQDKLTNKNLTEAKSESGSGSDTEKKKSSTRKRKLTRRKQKRSEKSKAYKNKNNSAAAAAAPASSTYQDLRKSRPAATKQSKPPEKKDNGTVEVIRAIKQWADCGIRKHKRDPTSKTYMRICVELRKALQKDDIDFILHSIEVYSKFYSAYHSNKQGYKFVFLTEDLGEFFKTSTSTKNRIKANSNGHGQMLIPDSWLEEVRPYFRKPDQLIMKYSRIKTTQYQDMVEVFKEEWKNYGLSGSGNGGDFDPYDIRAFNKGAELMVRFAQANEGRIIWWTRNFRRGKEYLALGRKLVACIEEENFKSKNPGLLTADWLYNRVFPKYLEKINIIKGERSENIVRIATR